MPTAGEKTGNRDINGGLLVNQGVTPCVGSHSFSWFSDAARPSGSTHPPNCIPSAPPSQPHAQNHTHTYTHVNIFHQPATPASVVTSHCSSSRAPLDDSGKSPLTHDEASFFNGDRSECVYVSAFVYVFVVVCMCTWVGFASDG